MNCAGDYCKNKFPEDLIYKTFYIKDSKIETIDCIFFDFINYLEQILHSNSEARILIHCVLGVSRSVTLSMAFLMQSYKMTFRHCFNFVKDKRGVASPNLGFVSQLLNFEKRINSPNEIRPQTSKGFSQVFVFGAHQREDPDYFVFRRVDAHKILEFQKGFEINKQAGRLRLDPRSVIIFVGKGNLQEKPGFLWKGGF